MKNNKGITLVALVVTIIVLLILAGVSVYSVLKDDGTMNEAKQAKAETNKASWIEEISTEILKKQTTSTGRMTEEELENILKEYGTLSTEENILDRTLTTKDGTKIKVTEIFIGKLAVSSDDAYDNVTVTAWIVEDTLTGETRIDVDTTVNYTGDLPVDELYYSYYIKSENDKVYELVTTEQNLTSYSIPITEGGKYIVMVEVSEDIDITEVVGVGKSSELTNANKYTVSFYAEDKTTLLQEVTVTEGETAIYTGTTPTKSEYTFQYWVEDGDTIEFDLSNITADTKLYPYFTTSGVCFVEGTKVLTENGLVNIEDIQIGMRVLSYNEETRKTEIKEVKNTFINYVSYDMCKVTVDGITVESTDGHEYYTVNKGWTDACELKVGDILLNSNNEKVIVEKVEVKKTNGLTTVYNFEVEDNHNYYVGENKVLVHNADSCVRTCCLIN